jgi:hypothetical protein
VLRFHLETATPEPGLDEPIAATSVELGGIATEGILRSGEAGRTGDGNITQQALRYVAKNNPDWVPDELAPDPDEEFARGAAQLVTDVLTRRRSQLEAASMLDTIAAELRSVRVDGVRT